MLGVHVPWISDLPDGEWLCGSVKVPNAEIALHGNRNCVVDRCSHGYLEDTDLMRNPEKRHIFWLGPQYCHVPALPRSGFS